jgi:hypothetical protein
VTFTGLIQAPARASGRLNTGPTAALLKTSEVYHLETTNTAAAKPRGPPSSPPRPRRPPPWPRRPSVRAWPMRQRAVPYSVIYDLRGDQISALRIYFPMSQLMDQLST